MVSPPGVRRYSKFRSDRRPLAAGYGQYGHDLDGIARENGKVRMLLEEPGGGLVRVRAHHRKGAQFVANVVDSALRDLLGFSQRSAHADYGSVMFVGPRLPGRHAFPFLGTAIALGKGVPGRPPRTGLAAQEHCEISIARAHDDSLLLRFAD